MNSITLDALTACAVRAGCSMGGWEAVALMDVDVGKLLMNHPPPDTQYHGSFLPGSTCTRLLATCASTTAFTSRSVP